MKISEKGCRAVYNARLKTGGTRRGRVRGVEAFLYPESCSGRIAAMIHNNESLFPSRCFTVVRRESFRHESAVENLECALTVFNEAPLQRITSRPTRSNNYLLSDFTGKNRVDQVLTRVRCLTHFQSEDPVWFLLRAFCFTSRTGH